MNGKTIVLTGFGPFRGIQENPTRTLVEAAGKDPKGLFDKGTLVSRVLETSMKGVHDGLDALKEELAAEGIKDDENCVWIHLGVYATETKFRLESKAFNEADFRCPDEQGEQPSKEPIESGFSTKKTRSTTLDLDQMCSELRDLGRGNCPVAVTGDPGKFVCNYVYYSSLMVNKNVLFIHVPEFKTISFERQYEFLRNTCSIIHNFVIESMRIPEEVLKPLQSMGFAETLIRRALLAVNQGLSTQAVEPTINWLMENLDKQGSDAPLRTYDDLTNIRRTSVEEYKVVMVVNSDLNMSTGKIASQVGHACLAMHRSLSHSQPDLLEFWQDGGEALVVCRANSNDIIHLARDARESGVPCTSIADAGRTQVSPGSLTVIAVGPGPLSQIDNITGHLKLL